MKNYLKMIRLPKLLFASPWAWLYSACTAAGSFFAPEAYTFSLVLIAVLLDAVFGITVSFKQKAFVLSKLGRVTIFKIFSYGAALIMVYMVERLVHNGAFVGVKVAAGWAAACEFWSMSASILIIWPDAYFFRIMRHHLKGEIQAKTGIKLEE